MEINGVKIESFSMFNQYFDFREIYNLLQSENAYLFYEFIRSDLNELRTLVAFQKIAGVRRTNGDINPNTGIRRLIENPALCLEEELAPLPGSAVFESCDTEAADVRLVRFRNIRDFKTVILYNLQESYTRLHPELAMANQADNPVWASFENSVEQAVDELTENGGRQFPPEAAVELYIYFLLHGLAAVPPDQEQSLSSIRQDLDQLCPTTDAARLQNDTFILQPDENREATLPLPYYDGTTGRDQPLSIVELQNVSQNMIKVAVEGTVLFRYVRPGKSIYILRKGGQFVRFIPRFRRQNGILTCCLDGRTYNKWNEIQQEIQTTVKHPVICVKSNEYGTFIIDKAGTMDKTAAWFVQFPEKPVVMADACAMDYSFLLSDGTTVNRLQRPEWDNQTLISIDLGLNAAVAICASRQPLLSGGREIPEVNASEARAYGDHYICQTRDGKIRTDSGLLVGGEVYAVAICSRGYILAYQDRISIYNDQNRLWREWPVSGVSELEADNQGLAYYDGTDGGIKTISF